MTRNRGSGGGEGAGERDEIKEGQRESTRKEASQRSEPQVQTARKERWREGPEAEKREGKTEASGEGRREGEESEGEEKESWKAAEQAWRRAKGARG